MPITALPGLDLLATPVILVDPQSCVRYLNSAAEGLFKLSRRAALGHPLGSLLPGLSKLSSAIEAARRDDLGFIGTS